MVRRVLDFELELCSRKFCFWLHSLPQALSFTVVPTHATNVCELNLVFHDAGNLLGEFVGYLQILSNKAHVALDVTIQNRLPSVIRNVEL